MRHRHVLLDELAVEMGASTAWSKNWLAKNRHLLKRKQTIDDAGDPQAAEDFETPEEAAQKASRRKLRRKVAAKKQKNDNESDTE